jgi:hypothetical protein
VTLTRAVLLASLVILLCAATPMADVSADAADPCCFTNPRYTGVCTVVPDADETCSSILAYLNNQNSVGKTYCGNTTIRGGWRTVDCAGG